MRAMELEKLGAKAVSCRAWEWGRGMRTVNHGIVVDIIPVQSPRAVLFRGGLFDEVLDRLLPDLSDYATVGWVVARLRDQLGAGLYVVEHMPGDWRVFVPDMDNPPPARVEWCRADSEAAVLVEALRMVDGVRDERG
jgi:hypothetical protein